MSLVGTFAVMYLLGYSLDNLSLMALTLAVGFVVDDAIVVLENVVRHMEQGESVLEAALNGSREISFTVLSMTLSLVAVFIPVLLLGGLIGRLFQEFAVTIAVAILVSGFVSLTLTPDALQPLAPARGRSTPSTAAGTASRSGPGRRSLAGYERSLAWVMDRRGLAMLFSLGILIGTVVLGRIVPKGFIPSEDTGQLSGTTETAEGTSFDAMVRHQRAAAAIVQEDPNVEGFMSSVGAGGRATRSTRAGSSSTSRTATSAPLDADAVAQSLTRKLAAVPGSACSYQSAGRSTSVVGSPRACTSSRCRAPTSRRSTRARRKLEQRLHDVPGLTDVTSDLQIKNPQVRVSINRDRASALGIDVNQIENALYNAYGARQVSTIYTPNDQYWVVMELLAAVPARPLGHEPAAPHGRGMAVRCRSGASRG